MPPTDPTSSVITGFSLRAPWARLSFGYGAICPKRCKITYFQEAVTSQGEADRVPQLAVFLHDKHSRTSDPLGNPREMTEPDSHGG